VFEGVKCKHIYAIEVSFILGETVKENIIIQQLDINRCPKCGSVAKIATREYWF
jgi:hypothetical protein